MWTIKQTEEFQEWFDEADLQLQENTLEHVEILRQFGPQLGRPYVDTLKGSLIPNLKELRFSSGNKVIRIFFVFDSHRNGVLLIGGNKASSTLKGRGENNEKENQKTRSGFFLSRKKSHGKRSVRNID